MKANMVKVLAASIAVACGAASAVDTSTDVLLWHIDLTDNWSTRNSPDFDSIKFVAVSSDETKTDLTPKTYASIEDLALLQAVENSNGFITDDSTILPDGTGSVAGYYYTDISGYGSGYSFMAEVWANGGVSAWMLSPVSYETLQQAGAVATLGELQGTDGDFNPQPMYNSYNMGQAMVPEPSGGLLMLIGGALLALRRKRKE